MTEGQVPAEAVTPTEAPGAPSAAPAGQEAQQQSVESVLDTDLPQADTFPRDYVEKLRQEAAGYRTKYRDVEGWTKFHDDYKDDFASVDELRGFVDQFKTREGLLNFTARVLQEMGVPLERVFGQQPLQAGEDLDRPLTRREFQELQQKQFADQQAAREDSDVKQALRDLNVTDAERNFVVAAAMKYPSHLGYAERIKRGHADVQKYLDTHAATIAQTDQQNREKTPGSLGGSPAVPSSEPPADWAEARKLALAAVDRANSADRP